MRASAGLAGISQGPGGGAGPLLPGPRTVGRVAAAITGLAVLVATGGSQAQEPPPRGPPAGLQRHLTGDGADAEVEPRGPALVLMGGGPDVDEAFRWWRRPLAGGDVVVLRTSGADGYNGYLFEEIGGCDSVETLLVTSRALADDPWVASRVEQAEGIFIAGGDQATYVAHWKGTKLLRALQAAWRRGAVVGGTSAGAAVLGQFAFSAAKGTITSPAALRDPFAEAVTLERDLLRLSFLDGCLVDTHVQQRTRRGRLVAFLSRLQADGWHEAPLGVALDERTALVVGRGGEGKVLGAGRVTLLRPTGPPVHCKAGEPLTVRGMKRWSLGDGDAVAMPAGTTKASLGTAAVEQGVLRE